MDIQVESRRDRRIIRIRGSINFENCPSLQNRLDSVLDDEVRTLMIDFKNVSFIDSSGIGEVLRLFRRMRDRGGELILMNPNKKLQGLFLMYRFDKFMKIEQDVDPVKG